MRTIAIWFAAFVIFAVLMGTAISQQNPITTGGFYPVNSAPSATLILLNQSRLSDGTLAEVANALSRRVLNVEIATRLAGAQTAVCGAGEWCLAVTDAMLGSGGDVAIGARLGSAIRREIECGMM